MLYDDGRVACDENNLILRWYYPWGTKKIPYRSIRSVSRRPMTGPNGRWRIWGSGDFVHWWNLDPRRPSKELALEIHTGSRTIPTISPDDPEKVERILAEHLAQ